MNKESWQDELTELIKSSECNLGDIQIGFFQSMKCEKKKAEFVNMCKVVAGSDGEVEPEKEGKLKNTAINHLKMYQRAINEIDDFFEYANESMSDRYKVKSILSKLTVSLSLSVCNIKPPVTEGE